MSFHVSASSEGSRNKFDSGPLSWVMDEIREALNQSKNALLSALSKDNEGSTTQLNHAGAYLHQAHGALQIVDVDGVPIIAEAVEDILRRIASGDTPLNHAIVRVIEQAYQALLEYLEELLAGEPPQPIRLYPYYKELQEIRGTERIHPADLFFPDLDARSQYAPPADPSDAKPDAFDVGDLRPRFEKALLRLLTSDAAPTDTANVADLRNVVAEIEQAQSNQSARDFWWVMLGFVEAVTNSDEPTTLFVKQVCGRMNRQIKLLAQGSSSVSDRLLLDALYCIARDEPPSTRELQIRSAYQLDELIPADFEKKRYGQIDAVALGMAKSALTQAKNTWHRVTKGEADATKSFAALILQLVEASIKLNSPPLEKLLLALDVAADQLPQSTQGAQLELEIATCLLFVENALDHLNRIDDDFPQRVDTLISRLESVAAGEAAPESMQWMDKLTQQSQQRQTVAVLAGEMESGLRQVERILDEYFIDSSKHETLLAIDPILHQIAGVLSILGQEDAMLAVQQTQADIKKFQASLDTAEVAPSQEFPASITQNITALGFFVEVLPQHPETAKTRFFFDREQGIFHANLLEKGAARPAALLTADPSFDPLLDVEEGEEPTAKPVAPPATTVASHEIALPASDEEIDAELLEIFISEAEEVLDFVKHAVPDARNHADDQDQLSTIRRSFHTLKGSGRMVGLVVFAEAAYSIEQVMNQWLAEARAGTPDLFALLEKSAEELSKWVADLRETGRSNRTPAALMRAAELIKASGAFHFDENDANAATPPSPADFDAASTAHAVSAEEDTGTEEQHDASQLTAGMQAQTSLENKDASSSNVIEFPMQVEHQETLDDNIKRIGHLEISVPLYNIFVAEADDILRFLSQDFSEWQHEPNRSVTPRAILAAHSLAGSSATVGFTAIQEVAHALEMYLQTLESQPMLLGSSEFDALLHCVAVIRQMMQQVAINELPSHQPDLLQLLHQIQQSAAIPAATAETLLEADAPDEFQPIAAYGAPLAEEDLPDLMEDDEAVSDTATVQEFTDNLDPDLLPVFLEEGRDLMPQIGQSLRGWLQHPADASSVPDILRYLHTAKGSARMAGAMMLGQHLHMMETQIETILQSGAASPHLLEDLLARHDHNMALFDHLQHPETERPQAYASAAAPATVEEQESAPTEVAIRQTPSPQMPTAKPAQAPVARVRVRADILDRLVNQAGEVSIARSKIENEVGTLRQSLTDLTDNLSRLRSQLREVEIQAESQITSRMGHSADREFDPLEFDRFSRLQELTRMMSESVDDVASIQDSLVRTVTGATSDLENQAQLTRSLQQDLMQVRMVPFSSISERLYQISRQAAKEVGKWVNLDIQGTTVEIDRGVLERMAGPLEHLLRNAIVHGIEPAELRKTAGKNDTGEITVEIRQEGNEVAIVIADDGQGLDLDRIREKAISSGLIPEDRDLSDSELENLIFSSGFSTASEVTELAGRGVGLDVVRAEAASLGGRVSVVSEKGKGTRFTINLPLTLAVTSVVLISAGDSTYAVPSVLVEQVQQLKSNSLATSYHDGSISWLGSRVPLYYLPTLLGDVKSTPIIQQYSPILILKSGSDRTALHVDEIIGNREVVVKNIGPQLARMTGIVGATVLGSGNIVLILNPVPLSQRAVHEGQSRLRALPVSHDASENALDPAQAVVPADQGLRKKNIVMVVDDSLTVRRVTQRFLLREGYQVVLAKDGVDALEKLQEIKPDIMLVDIEMPRMDGFDLIRNVRSDSRIAKTPIIMITSRTASKHRNYAMELGANEYYGKPFQEAQLLDTIQTFLHAENEERVD